MLHGATLVRLLKSDRGDDAGLRSKFDRLAGPVLSPARAAALGDRLWTIESCADMRPLVEAAAKAPG